MTPELLNQLMAQRELAVSPDSGDVVKRDAWLAIDALLDCLNELNALPRVEEVSSGDFL